MEALKTFAQENRILLFAGAVGVVAGVLLIKNWRNRSSQVKPTSAPAIEKNALTFNERFIELVKTIQQMLDRSKNQLEPEILKAIYRGQYYLAEEEAKKLISTGRQRRREKLQEKEDYAAVVLKYEKELEELLDKHLGGILAYFDIDKQTWIEEITHWCASSEEADEEWQDLINEQEEKLYSSLRNDSRKPLKLATIKSMLEFKIRSLEVLEPTSIGLMSTTEESSRYTIVECYIKDLVYKQFTVEEEDIDFSFSELKEAEKESLDALFEKINALMSNYLYEAEGRASDEEIQRVSGASGDEDYY